MEYIIIKYIHILSAIVMFGTGMGIAWFKLMTDWKGSIANKAFINRSVVIADMIFTAPSVILQPITGIWMLYQIGAPWNALWVWLSLILYAIAGLCWLPVVFMQIRMRNMAQNALESESNLSPTYNKLVKIWAMLGIPSFIAMVLILWLMTAKPV